MVYLDVLPNVQKKINKYSYFDNFNKNKVKNL